VGVAEGTTDLDADVKDDVQRQACFGLEQLAQGETVDELHYEQVVLSALHEVIDGDDVRVLELGDEAGLPIEEPEVPVRLGRGLAQHLEGDGAREPLGPLLERAVDLAESALTEQPLDEEGTQLCPCGQGGGHGCRRTARSMSTIRYATV
jgi:hypothetical protein